MKMQRKKSFHKKDIILGELTKFGKKTQKTMQRFLTFVKIEPKKENEKGIEKIKGKVKILDDEPDLIKEEELQLKELTKGLYNLLKEECVLCGQEMINSTQIKFSKEDENIKWGKLVC